MRNFAWRLEFIRAQSSLVFLVISLSDRHRHLRLVIHRNFLYAGDLVLIVDSTGELEKLFKVWKLNLESRGLKVVLAKMKILVCRKEDRHW